MTTYPTQTTLTMDRDAAARYLVAKEQLATASHSQRVEMLADIAREVRRDIVTTIQTAGLGHIGGDLSVTDILVTQLLGRLERRPGGAGGTEP